MTASPSKARAHTGGGTGRVMNLRDGLSLAAIVGSLALIFAIPRFDQPERVKPGSPEYDAYIEHYIADVCEPRSRSIRVPASRPPKPSAKLPVGSRCCKPTVSIPTTARSSISSLLTIDSRAGAPRRDLTNA